MILPTPGPAVYKRNLPGYLLNLIQATKRDNADTADLRVDSVNSISFPNTNAKISKNDVNILLHRLYLPLTARAMGLNA